VSYQPVCDYDSKITHFVDISLFFHNWALAFYLKGPAMSSEELDLFSPQAVNPRTERRNRDTIQDLRQQVKELEVELEASQEATVQWMRYYSQSASSLLRISKLVNEALSKGGLLPWQALVVIESVLREPHSLHISACAFRGVVIDHLIRNLKSSASKIHHANRSTVEGWLVDQKGVNRLRGEAGNENLTDLTDS
jgi:hypothetical protein